MSWVLKKIRNCFGDSCKIDRDDDDIISESESDHVALDTALDTIPIDYLLEQTLAKYNTEQKPRKKKELQRNLMFLELLTKRDDAAEVRRIATEMREEINPVNFLCVVDLKMMNNDSSSEILTQLSKDNSPCSPNEFGTVVEGIMNGQTMFHRDVIDDILNMIYEDVGEERPVSNDMYGGSAPWVGVLLAITISASLVPR